MIPKKHYWLLMLLAILLLGGWIGLQIYDVSYVNVKVTDSQGNPVPNFSVEATCNDGQSNSGYTNEQGAWTTSFLGPVVCKVTIYGENGYADSETKYINVMETGHYAFTVLGSAVPSPTKLELTVVVHDAGFPTHTAEQAIVYAKVEVKDSAVQTEYTNEDGLVRFQLEKQAYTITVSKEGYDPQTRTISLSESTSTTFLLTKQRPSYQATINVPATVAAKTANEASITIKNIGSGKGIIVERKLHARNLVDGQTRPLWESTDTLLIDAGDFKSFTATFYSPDWYDDEKWTVGLDVRDAEEGWFYNLGVTSFTISNPEKPRPTGTTKTRWIDPNEGETISEEYTFIFKVESGEISEGVGVIIVLTGSDPDNVRYYDTFKLNQTEVGVWKATYDTTNLVDGQYKLQAVFQGYDYDLPGYVEMTNLIFIRIENPAFPYWLLLTIPVAFAIAYYFLRKRRRG